jgi:hypothetical protein
VNSQGDVNLDLASLHQAARELLDPQLRNYHFMPSEGSTDESSATHVYRGGDRFLVFRLEAGQPPRGNVHLGIGAEDAHITEANSMSLGDLVELSFGGSNRGRYVLGESTVQNFLQQALHDLVEFAHEFLYGDIRSFIRLLAIRNRERHTDPSQHVSLH